jgi:hypothetical protein
VAPSTYLGNVFIELTSLSFCYVAVGDSNLVDKTESAVASEQKAPTPAAATFQSAAAADIVQSAADADNAQTAAAADTSQSAAAADTSQSVAAADTSQSVAAADASQSAAAADTAQPATAAAKKKKATDDGSSTGDRSTGEEEEETPKPRPGGKRHGRAECGVCGQIVTQVGGAPESFFPDVSPFFYSVFGFGSGGSKCTELSRRKKAESLELNTKLTDYNIN